MFPLCISLMCTRCRQDGPLISPHRVITSNTSSLKIFPSLPNPTLINVLFISRVLWELVVKLYRKNWTLIKLKRELFYQLHNSNAYCILTGCFKDLLRFMALLEWWLLPSETCACVNFRLLTCCLGWELYPFITIALVSCLLHDLHFE